MDYLTTIQTARDATAFHDEPVSSTRARLDADPDTSLDAIVGAGAFLLLVAAMIAMAVV